MLIGVHGNKGEEVIWAFLIYYVIKSYIIFPLHQIHYQVKGDEMGSARSGHGE
jgi:hypothetical protein